MTYRARAAVLAFALAPFFAAAQTGDVPPTGVGLYCPHITQNLQFKDCDSGHPSPSCKRYVTGMQVTELQKFLADYYDLDYTNNVSGFFGARTLQNVQRFQQDNNLTPPAGYVGPITRAKIQAVCGNTTSQDQPPTPSPQNQSCTTPWGSTIAHNTIVLAYQNYTVPAGQSCLSQNRTCTNGTLSGSYSYAQCSATSAYCTPLPAETRTQSCAAGYNGTILEMRTSSCAANATTPTWGAWTQTANTCVPIPNDPTTPNTASCTTPWGTIVTHNTSVTAYQSSTVPAGQQCAYQSRTCSNGTLSGSYQYASCSSATDTTTYSWQTGAWGQCTNNQQTRTVQCVSNTGAVVADSFCVGTKPAMTRACSSTMTGNSSITATPAYGPAPFAIWIKSFHVDWQDILNAYADSLPMTDTKISVDYGDGSPPLRAAAGCTQGGGCNPGNNNFTASLHTYTNPGTYIIKLLVRDIEVARTQVSVSQNAGGSNQPGTTLYAVTPLSGKAPLAVSFFVKYSVSTSGITPRLYFGDGDSSSVSKGLLGISPEIIHVYNTPGTYTAYTEGGYVSLPHGSATIVISGGTASTQNESQLAAAYTVLVSLLEQMIAAMR